MEDLDFVALAGMSDEDLYRELGRTVTSDDFGAGRPSSRELIRRGRAWLTAEWGTIRTAVCADPRVQAFIADENSEARALFGAVVDCLLALFKTLPVALIATLIIRMGITNMCRAGNDSAPTL